MTYATEAKKRNCSQNCAERGKERERVRGVLISILFIFKVWIHGSSKLEQFKETEEKAGKYSAHD